MMDSPLWVYYKSLQSVYAITNKRGISTTIRSYPPEKLQNVFRRERKNGTGDIILSFTTWRDSDGDTRTNDIGFINIREPKTVEQMLKKLAGKTESSGKNG